MNDKRRFMPFSVAGFFILKIKNMESYRIAGGEIVEEWHCQL